MSQHDPVIEVPVVDQVCKPVPLGNSVGIPMGTQRPTHTHTHHGSVPTHVGMGMCVGWWVFPMGLPATATTTTTIYHDNIKTTTMSEGYKCESSMNDMQHAQQGIQASLE